MVSTPFLFAGAHQRFRCVAIASRNAALIPPVVHAEEIVRNIAKHLQPVESMSLDSIQAMQHNTANLGDLGLGHCGMRTQRREHVLDCVL